MTFGTTDPWVSAGAAVEITGWTKERLYRAAANGEVATRTERGSAPLYLRSDLLRVSGLLN
jgi:hypothetical protein